MTPDPLDLGAFPLNSWCGHSIACDWGDLPCDVHLLSAEADSLRADIRDLRERIARDVEEACAATADRGVPCSWCVHATRIIRGG